MNEKQTKLDFISIFMELRGYVLKRKVLWGFQRRCPQHIGTVFRYQRQWHRWQPGQHQQGATPLPGIGASAVTPGIESTDGIDGKN